MLLKPPPRIKVLEALGAVADGRVRLLDDSGRYAVVTGSDGSRVYRVYVDPERGVAYSDDNGTKLRGYIGYPIVAVLMLQGVLPLNRRVAEALKGIPWRRLNEEYKRYARVMEEVLRVAEERGVPRSEVLAEVSRVYEELRRLKLRRLPEPPPGPWPVGRATRTEPAGQ